MTTSHLAVEAHDLVKTFGATRAVHALSLSVPVGTVLGLLGPNGAGKTTTIRMVTTLTAPDSGTIEVFGRDLASDPEGVRARLSVTGQFASLDDDLTGSENLVLQARLRGLRGRAAAVRTEELLEVFGLGTAARRVVSTYSGGMRRRLDLALGLVVTPDLLVLDEPTTGLDPRSRAEVWDIVRAAVSDGATVLLTTQYLDEADQLSDRIAVIDHGRLVAVDTPDELKLAVGSGVLTVRVVDPRRRDDAARVLAGALRAPVDLTSDPATVRVRLARTGGDTAEDVNQALIQLSRAGITPAAYALGQPSLDEVFLALT
ncbi:ATP-binding cassette domain-containing protein, partial [Intrasporangium sp.]|uniref:ATP-binding cassette domain-containing protein n=1 Tax=Intrasporangium sp. TaxID=1925024 RepID=UPI00293AB3F5